MGQKMFINNTQYSVSVQLEVRKGSTPGSVESIKDFNLAKGQQEMVKYSGDANPYLDAIVVSLDEGGDLVSTQHFVLERGSPVDNQFNTHDTVTITNQDENILLAYSNTWTV